MDVSKEYIKMCDCEEIQGEHKIYGEHDYYGYENDFEIWLPRQDQLWNMLGDISFEVYKGANVNPEGYGVSHYDSPYDSEPVWHFEGDSLEICLLKILMWEKHTALWTGTEWDRAHWTKEEVKELV